MNPESGSTPAEQFALELLRDEDVDLERASRLVAEAVFADQELAERAAPLLRANGAELIRMTRGMLAVMQETFSTRATTAMSEWLRRSEAEMLTLVGEDDGARSLIGLMTAEVASAIRLLDEAFETARTTQADVPDFLALLAEPTDEAVEPSKSQIDSVLRTMVSQLSAALPTDWPPEHLLRLVEMVVDERLPIVTGVPTSTILACLAAWEQGANPWASLAEHHDQILESLMSDLSGDDRLADGRAAALLDAAELAADGRWRGAICSALPIIDSFIYRRRFGSYGQAQRASVGSSHEVPVGSLRETLVLHCLAPIYASFDVVRDRPPEDLNRHAVVHTVDPLQFTRSNALRTILLAANTFALEGH